jgi:hypothetical protein
MELEDDAAACKACQGDDAGAEQQEAGGLGRIGDEVKLEGIGVAVAVEGDGEGFAGEGCVPESAGTGDLLQVHVGEGIVDEGHGEGSVRILAAEAAGGCAAGDGGAVVLDDKLIGGAAVGLEEEVGVQGVVEGVGLLVLAGTGVHGFFVGDGGVLGAIAAGDGGGAGVDAEGSGGSETDAGGDGGVREGASD